MFENLSNIIPQDGELVVSGDTVIDTEVVEGTVEETVVDNAENDTELVTDTVAEDNTTADPLDEDKSKKFVINNWLKEHNTSELLYRLWLKGAALYMQNGLFWFRQSVYTVFLQMPKSQAQDAVANVLGQAINIGQTDEHKIKVFDLLNVENTRFNPFAKSEFYLENGVIYRNSFRPTLYMELPKNQTYKEPKAIFALIRNLVVSEDRFHYYLNWFANYFQSLRKTPVAIVLKGDQGSGKGILVDEVITPLLGDKQCFQINDKTIRTNYMGSIVEGRLFINCDEITHTASDNKTLKNLLKMLVSNKKGSFEKKYANIDEETPLYALILFTSNAALPIEIEHGDRRFTVFKTGINLSKLSFLGYGSANKLIEAIQSELEDFAVYLLNYPVDHMKASIPMETPEKEAMKGSTNDKFLNFYQALKTKNLVHFADLRFDNPAMYNEVLLAFRSNRISRPMIRDIFNALEDDRISTKKLMTRLRSIDVNFFSESNMKKRSDGNDVYCLDESIDIDAQGVDTSMATPANAPINLPGFTQFPVMKASL